MLIKDLQKYLENKGCNLIGCSNKEIAKIEDLYGIELPQTYKDYLLAMGKSADDYMKGSSVFYDEIFDLKDGSSRLLQENDFKSLPENAFVFWMHQGYQFAFFYLNEGDDPPVYFYYEGANDREFVRKEESLTDFLKKQIAI